MSKAIVKSSFWVTLLLLVGYFVSFIKESVIANYFGVSAEVDAYTIAIAIPVNLFGVIARSVQPIVIPIYTKLLYTEEEATYRNYLNNLISIVIAISIVLIVLIGVFSEPITYIFAPGLSSSTRKLVIEMLWLILPTALFTVLDRIFIAVLNVHKQFVIPSISLYFLNATLIVVIVTLHSVLGIKAACVGQVIGSILQVLFLFIIMRKYHVFRFTFDIYDSNIRKTGKQVIPVMWSASIAEINEIVNRIVASLLFVGAVSAIGYSSKVNTVLMLFFTSAIGTIVYPLYAESTAKKDIEQLKKRVNLTLSAYSYFLLPLMIFVLCTKKEIIETAFARGAFDEDAVNLTQSLLGYYSIGILFLAFRDILTKVFYSLQDTITPAKNTSIGFVANILLSISLPFVLGVQGLAIAASISAAFVSIRLFIQLINKHPEIELKVLVTNIKAIIIPVLIMALCIMQIRGFLSTKPFLCLILSLTIGSLVYIVMSLLVKVPITKTMIQMVFSKNEKKNE